MRLFLNLEASLRRNLIIFFGASLCFWGGLAGMLPNLALYIRSFGASNQEVGWVMASFAVGLLGFRPKMSRLTDTRGRKPALLIGVVVIALAPILYLDIMLVPQVTFTLPGLGWDIKLAVLLLALVRAFHGLSVAAFATAYTAAVADMAPPKNRGELISFMSLAGPTGMAMGPALGGYFKDSFALAFLAMTAIGTLGTLLVLISKEPPRPALDRPKADVKVAQRTESTAQPMLTQTAPSDDTQKPTKVAKKQPLFWSLMFAAPIRIPALMLFMVGTAFGAMVTFVPLYVEKMAWDINIGLIFTVSAIASFSIRTFSGTASDQLGRGRFISLGLTFYTLSMLTLYFANGPEMLLLAGAFQGAGSGTTIPIIAALMTDRSRPGERGLTFGLCLTGFDLGIALAGPIMGQIADLSGSYSLVFALAGIMTALGLAIFITTSSKDLPHSVQFALNGGRDVYAIKSATP
ncbi:MAG: MFS transporter [Cyanobacteria bacterium J06597_16]